MNQDIRYFRSTYDENNADRNGGGMNTNQEILPFKLNSLLPRVRPGTAKNGGERWFKFYIRAYEDLIDLGITKVTDTSSPDEEVYFSDDGANHESDLDKDNVRLYGSFIIDNIDADNKKITCTKDVDSFVKKDDVLTFYRYNENTGTYKRIGTMEVDHIDDDNKNVIYVKEWTADITDNDSGSSTITLDNLDKGHTKQIWLKEVINKNATLMEEPPNNIIFNIWYDYRNL